MGQRFYYGARGELARRRIITSARVWIAPKFLHDSSSGSNNSSAHSEDELYDLKNDPWELTNVAQNAEHVGVISNMRGLLVDWMLETEDYNPVPLPTVIGRGTKPEIDTTR